MGFLKHFRLNKLRLQVFATLFIGFLLVNVLIVYLIGGFWDGPLSVGFPLPINTIGCGMMVPEISVCNTGFHALNLLVDLIIWYFISTFVKRNR